MPGYALHMSCAGPTGAGITRSLPRGAPHRRNGWRPGKRSRKLQWSAPASRSRNATARICTGWPRCPVSLQHSPGSGSRRRLDAPWSWRSRAPPVRSRFPSQSGCAAHGTAAARPGAARGQCPPGIWGCASCREGRGGRVNLRRMQRDRNRGDVVFFHPSDRSHWIRHGTDGDPSAFPGRRTRSNGKIRFQTGLGAATASSNAASASESGMAMRLGGSALVQRMAAETL